MTRFLAPQVFLDTSYMIALLDKDDPAHLPAKELMGQLKEKKFKLFTSEFVLLEFLNSFSTRYFPLRPTALEYVTELRSNAGKEIQVIPLNQPGLFFRALTRYYKFADKRWSLTDCTSFELMGEFGIPQAATKDSDFDQAGFLNLLQWD